MAPTRLEAVVEIEVLPVPAFDWDSQAEQYAPTGKPGIRLEQHLVDVNTGKEVFNLLAALCGPHISAIDCLLHRDDDGALIGILNHYDGKHPLEKSDAINVWTHPSHQKRGIASGLVIEALRRWPGIRPEGQRYTEDGVHLLESLLRRSEA